MRGYNDDNDRPRPIFSRSADGRLHAGNSHIAPTQREDAEPIPKPRKEPPVLRIPPQPQTRIFEPLQAEAERPSQPQQTKHTAADSVDIGDMWTEQERIRLHEDWKDEQRKHTRRLRRKALFRKKVTGVPSPAKQDTTVPVTTRGNTQQAHTDPKEITLNINMPSISKVTLPKLRIPALPKVSKGRLVIAGVLVVASVAGVVSYNIFQSRDNKGKAAATNNQNEVAIEHLDASKQNGKPDYDTILPNGSSIEKYGAWVRVSPADKNPVYAYADKINNVLINVSQQPLPDAFKEHPESSLASLAKQYSASDKITTTDNITAYVGTSMKGPQSVLFIKENLLIMIKSASRIPDDKWGSYISSLE